MPSLRNFDLNLLLVFETLLAERHATRAAEKLHLSQPALSHALKRLREALDDPLLVRMENGMQPTPRALELLPGLQQALALLQASIEPPAPFDPAPSSHRFVIATTDYFEEVLYPPFLVRLKATAPGIAFDIELITADVLQVGLEQRRVDLVVGPEAGDNIPHGLAQTPWLAEALVCLAASDNPAVGNALNLAQFVSHPQVALSNISGFQHSSIDAWLERCQLRRRVTSRNLNYMAAARVVADRSDHDPATPDGDDVHADAAGAHRRTATRLSRSGDDADSPPAIRQGAAAGLAAPPTAGLRTPS